MTKEEKLKAMREIVRDLGEKKKTVTGHEVISLAVLTDEPIVDEDDICTFVEIDHRGKLNVMGFDGETYVGGRAEYCDEKGIDKLYNAMLEMGKAEK